MPAKKRPAARKRPAAARRDVEGRVWSHSRIEACLELVNQVQGKFGDVLEALFYGALLMTVP